MSGTYTECPRCRKRANQRRVDTETALALARASKNFDEYDRLMQEKGNDSGPDAYPKESLLERSEIAMLRDGKGFWVIYHANCERCGWTYDFQFEDRNLTAGIDSSTVIHPTVKQGAGWLVTVALT